MQWISSRITDMDSNNTYSLDAADDSRVANPDYCRALSCRHSANVDRHRSELQKTSAVWPHILALHTHTHKIHLSCLSFGLQFCNSKITKKIKYYTMLFLAWIWVHKNNSKKSFESSNDYIWLIVINVKDTLGWCFSSIISDIPSQMSYNSS